MNRTSIAVALAAAAGVAVPWIITNDYYVNLASQILIYALLALSLNLLLGYGGMVSLGHAAFLGLTGYSTILLVLAGYDQLTTAILSVVFSTACGALFGVLALRASGIGFLMITLALGQIVWGIAYRANELTGGDNGITLPARPAPFGIDINSALELLLFHPDRVCDRLVLHLAADALAVRRGAVRHPRPAAPHVHARPQCVDGAVADFRDRLLLGVDFGHALHLLQPVHEPARDLAAAIGRGAADGDSWRREHALRTHYRRRHHHDREERREHVHRALEYPARLIFVVVIMFMPYGLVPGCVQLWRRLTNRIGGRKPAAPGTASEPAA